MAGWRGSGACLRALLGAGAGASAVSGSGYLPLYVAAQEGRADCVRALLEAGAPVDGCVL